MIKKTMQQNKRGQVTIFIILAILIVGGILTYIFYVQPTYLNPNAANLKIENCAPIFFNRLRNRIEPVSK